MPGNSGAGHQRRKNIMSALLKNAFRAATGITGAFEAILGLSIVFFASQLQPLLDTAVQPEPLYFRILGMMDAFIGASYVCIGLRPEKYRQFNKGTCLLRLGLSCVFFAEGFWLLDRPFLRLVYQFLAFFDLSLFIAQAAYLRQTAPTSAADCRSGNSSPPECR
jgi:hypothetical protein